MRQFLILVFLWSCTAPIVVPTPEPVTEIYPPYDKLIIETAKANPLPKLPCDVVSFIKGIAYAESGYDPRQVYKEPASIGGMNSIGLLQLSLNDQKNYKLDCGWKTEDDLKNGASNIKCGIQIMSRLCAKHPGETILECGGRYWSVLRPTRSGYQRFLSVCK